MSKIREGVTIKVRPETRNRLIVAKRGKETYDDLFNWLLDHAGERYILEEM